MEFTDARLWKSSLAQQPDDKHDRARERLRNAFLKFRERAAQLAEEIKRDLPEFTEHGVTHLDALWEMADLIAGKEISLTPTEAFVLGGAFLIHDTGMGLAAYPEGPAALHRDPGWLDIVTATLKRKLGRAPSDYERKNLDKESETEVIGELLRLRHAKHADKLATVSWNSLDGKDTYYLIEDIDLRKAYGPAIGKIAHSHWWYIDEVRKEMATKPPLPPQATMGCPSDWTVDHLKLACLLRTADAIHLDARRAPGYLRALRKPSGYADLHWAFQEHIHKPNIDGERLVFTAGNGFTLEESPAWWVGYELLQNADRELRQVDTLLQDLKRGYRFAARSVAGVESPRRLVNYIPPEGWVPVDARIQVSNVAALVRNLGGEQLYGKDLSVPLRELIQNATDAVRARRLLQTRPANWGAVTIRTGKDEQGEWIEVEDTGLGMSTEVLSGTFLDFGKSFWGTAQMREEWPGLQGKGFESTGKYGIGFFSVFMWGDRVHVVTRKYKDREDETWVLEFNGGLEVRPILRSAQESEFLPDGGTRVRVWLKTSLDSILTNHPRAEKLSLDQFYAWLCPSLDANLYVDHEPEGRRKLISASDWKTMDGSALCQRMWVEYQDKQLDQYQRKGLDEQLKAAINYRPLTDPTGEVVGRASISIHAFGPTESSGVLTVGGFRTGKTTHFAGILLGTPTRAARDKALPLVTADELRRWASEQATLATNIHDDPMDLVSFAEYVRSCGGDTDLLPIAAHGSEWVNVKDIAEKKDWPQEVLLVSSSSLIYGLLPHETFLLNPGILAVPMDERRPFIDNLLYGSDWPITNWINPSEYFTLRFALIEALAKSWGAAPGEVISASTLYGGSHRGPMKEDQPPGTRIRVGLIRGKPWEEIPDVIRNPRR